MEKYHSCGHAFHLTTRWNGVKHVIVLLDAEDDDAQIDDCHCPSCGEFIYIPQELHDEPPDAGLIAPIIAVSDEHGINVPLVAVDRYTLHVCQKLAASEIRPVAAARLLTKRQRESVERALCGLDWPEDDDGNVVLPELPVEWLGEREADERWMPECRCPHCGRLECSH
jgi:hypothetical protein